MTIEARPPRHARTEIELWSNLPARPWEVIGPVETRLRVMGEVSPETEQRIDRRLARAAHALGADAVLQVERATVRGADATRLLEARGTAVRWTGPPVAGPAIAAARPAPTPAVRPAPTHAATHASPRASSRATSQSQSHGPGVAALARTLEARAQQLRLSDPARARIERWEREAQGGMLAAPHAPHAPHASRGSHGPPAPELQVKLPQGCIFALISIGLLWFISGFGSCLRMLGSTAN